MEFEIQDCTLTEFLRSIQQIEQSIHFSFENAQNENTWNRLGHNVQYSGRRIFHLKVNNGEVSSIPLGNYYIEFYYYSKSGQQVVGQVDLYWNKNGYLTGMAAGTQPLFLFQKIIENTMQNNKKIIHLKTMKKCMQLCVVDRLKQICSKKRSLPDPGLLQMTLQHVLKNSEKILPIKKNALKKIDNKVIWINKAKNESGQWTFFADGNPKGTLSDAFNDSNSIDLDALKKVIEYFPDLVLGEASEEGGNKGTLVILNKELQKLRFNKKVYETHYSDTCYGTITNSNGKEVIYSIFQQPEKVFARIKTFITSDGCAAQNISEVKTAENEDVVFYRHQNYMASKKENIGKINPNVFNVLVAFSATDESAADMNLDKFECINKNEYSKLLHGTDCHLPISPELANMNVRINRTINEPLTWKHLSYEFQDVIKQLENGEMCTIPADTVIGYKAVCEEETCNSIMFPIQIEHEFEDGSYSYREVQASHEDQNWHCPICGTYKKMKGKAVKITNKYKNATEANITKVALDKENMEININTEIVTPINISRSISVEGVKGLTVPMKNDFIGYVTGEYYDPTTDSYRTLPYMSVDMICPLGALKSKNSGVGVAHLRMLNALTGNNICIDELIKDKQESQISKILKKCKKATLSRRVYNKSSNRFEYVQEEVHIGIISLDVTEVGDEFLKVKSEYDPMKVSFMNNLFYNWLGFDKLNKAMINSSLENFEKQEELIIELLKIFYGDIDGLKEVSLSDFNNKKGRFNIVSWIKKEEWANVLLNHPLMQEGGKFEKGAYCRDLTGNIIIFPSRKTILKLVDLVDGDKIRLHGIVKNAFGIFLDMHVKGRTFKLGAYKRDIYSKLTGKHGLLAKASTFINVGAQGKEIGCGYIPTGVIIIGDDDFWKMAKFKMEELGLSYKAICRGDQKLFGTSQRDPFIWLFQALNAVELWPISRANKYFNDNYGIKFTDMYHNFNGIMLNVLDMLYLYQTDADGDLRRILVPFDVEAQKELSKLRNKMINYDILCNSPAESHIGKIYNKVKKWHLDYVIKEASGSAVKPNERLEIKTRFYMTQNKNESIIKGINSKRNIGIITTSQWKIQDIANFFYVNNLEVTVNGVREKISKDDRNLISVFYQNIFTQEGCVRALKGSKDLGKCSLDEIAFNDEISWKTAEGEMKRGTVRDMVRDEAIAYGYGDIIDKFFALCDWWKMVAAIIKGKDGVVKSDSTMLFTEAELINAYISLCNGSKYTAPDRNQLFERLVDPLAEGLYERSLLKGVGEYLSNRFKNIDVKGEK